MISGREATKLIARREIVVRSRDKTLAVSTLITIVIIAAVILLPSVFGGASKVTVAVAGDGAAGVVEATKAVQKPFDIEVAVKRYASDDAIRTAVEDGTVAVGLLEDGQRILVSGNAADGAVAALQAGSQIVRQTAEPPPPLAVTEVDEEAQDRKAFALVALILLYGQLLGLSFLVAGGVVEEKASRIVEILLSTVQPKQLLAGKVVGIGIVGLFQLLLIAAVGLLLAAVSGSVDIGARQLSALPIVLAWFAIGYALYACLFAMAGALVSRQEDLQSVTTPLMMIILATFFLGFQATDQPDGGLATVMGYIPVSSPLIMPVRMIAGDVSVAEVVISVALILAAIYITIVFAGRMYGRAVLRTGGRVKLREVL